MQITDFTLSKRKTPHLKTSHKGELTGLLTHCHQVSLSTFIRCIVHNDYTGLIQSGNPTPEKLYQAWEYVYMEYCDLSGDVNHRQILNLSKEVGYLESKLLTIRSCCLVLSIRYSKTMADILHRIGYRQRLDPASGQAYYDDINSIVKKSKAILIAIEQKRYEHEQLLKQYEGQKIDEAYFDEALVELGRFMGFRLDPQITTVSEFVAIRNRFDREMKRLQAEHDKMAAKLNRTGYGRR